MPTSILKSIKNLYNVLNKINEHLINDSLKIMKPKKSDSIFDTVSNYYINGPSELTSHLTKLIRAFLVHGKVSNQILVCTLLPLVKDNLGDVTSSENYRAIAGGCLLLKLIDIVILMIESDKLNFDEMQFAYQEKNSTTVCTWTVSSVIEHYNAKGSPVYGAAMDMSKAFDMVKWGELFSTLRQRKVDPLFLRLMAFIYSNQQCNVKWNSEYSYNFQVKNGVRQGAVSSAILFEVYINELMTNLKKTELGCHIDGVFFGAVIFADKVFLLSGSRSGLQVLVDTCDAFASKKNLKFGTNSNPQKSNTKCLVFSKNKKDQHNIINVKLQGVLFPGCRK